MNTNDEIGDAEPLSLEEQQLGELLGRALVGPLQPVRQDLIEVQASVNAGGKSVNARLGAISDEIHELKKSLDSRKVLESIRCLLPAWDQSTPRDLFARLQHIEADLARIDERLHVILVKEMQPTLRVLKWIAWSSLGILIICAGLAVLLVSQG